MAAPSVRPDVRAFLDFMNARPGPGLPELGADAARVMMARGLTLLEPEVGALAVRRDLACPGAEGGQIALRLFDARAERPPGPALLYFHGGGFVLGDLDHYAPLCAEIARGLDLPVLAVDYRLAPEHRWPAAPDDCEAAARWVAANDAALERVVTGLVLAGDSAGGNLAIVTALALRDRAAAVPVIAQWSIYPSVDVGGRYASFETFGEGFFLSHAEMRWFDGCYRGDPTSWRALPLLAAQAGLPPTLVLTAGLDPLRDQGRAYAGACIAAGVPTVYREAAGTIHGFLTLRKAIPSAQADLAACLAVLAPMIAEAEAAAKRAPAAAA